MKELIKNQYKNLILVLCYMTISTLVYVVAAECIWEIWWLDVIVGLIVIGIGIYIGYRYIKSEEEARIKKLEKENEANKASSDIVEENNNAESKINEAKNEEEIKVE
jgi:uncharacterized membrane protein